MEKQEIIAGLKHAIERGYNIDMAIQSFVNAGYNLQDVKDSADAIGSGIISSIDTRESQQKQQSVKPIQPAQQIQSPQQTLPKIQPAQQTILPPPIEKVEQEKIKFQKLTTEGYNPGHEKISKAMLILLISLLLFLLVALGVLVVARTTVIGWFS